MTPISSASSSSLPARHVDAQGRVHIKMGAIIGLAGPLMANTATQMALNLIDTWYVGRISTDALAGMGAIHWLVIVFIGLLGGVGMAAQTVVAQAHGARRFRHASQATWTAVWATLWVAPIFVLLAQYGDVLLRPFGLSDHVRALALEFWNPRMLGAPLGVIEWALLGFFNGIGRPRITLQISLFTLVLNAALAPLFMFTFNMGIAGAAWATNCATLVAVILALWLFLKQPALSHYNSTRTHRLNRPRLLQMFKLGLPMGVMLAADVFGFALFQLMQVRLSPADGAASQITMMLTSLAYMPAIGIALAGTTLVGQSIGAGDREWARRLGNRIILMATGYMGGMGLLLGLNGPWLIPLFVTHDDLQFAAVVSTGTTLLWLAGAYQLFDGMMLGSSFCLRGAGDAHVPAALVVGLSWFLFVPLAHSLCFAPGQGWVDGLPQFGLGAKGGWIAAVIYIFLIGNLMFLRWRSNIWQRIQLQ